VRRLALTFSSATDRSGQREHTVPEASGPVDIVSRKFN
jgi:hypothetical protein